MSKDIRSFFKVQSKPKTQPIILHDDEIIPESPEIQITKKKRESRKRRIVDDSSDEEKFPRKSNEDKKKINTQKNKTQSPIEVKKSMKEVKAVEILGTNPVKRTEPIVKKTKRSTKTEIGIHSDEEFEKSLLELDDDKESTTDIRNIENDSCITQTDQKLNGNTSVTLTKRTEGSSVTSEDDNRCNIKLNNSNAGVNKKERIKHEKNEKKRDFSEFINHTEHISTQKLTDENQDTQNKKRKLEKTLNESVLSDEDRYEKKRMLAILYQNYLHRSGPKHLGSKVIPEGTPTCLKDCAILLTGVLDSFERDEIAAAITKYGGTIKNSVSKKVTHVLVGEDAGPAKISKAKELGIKIINEDDFLNLIQELSKGLSKNIDNELKTNIQSTKKKKTPEKNEDKKKNKMDSIRHTKQEKEITSDKLKNFEKKIQNNFYDKQKKSEKLDNTEKIPERISSSSSMNSNNEDPVVPPHSINGCADSLQLMWVDKYKPQTIKQIIGQHGDASNAKKLSNWLMRWYINRKEKIPKPSPWSKNDDGAYYKATLLSGPPGVGKTTTVMLVCKELGFDMVEFNASDTRNKTLIREQISELLTTTSLSGYAKGNTGKKAITKKHVLVMDEVDGMAGNEDRGGLQELISLIKITAVPIICMCNDRNSQKMRTLVNYCYDLKFNRPRVDQIKSAMMSVCFKEGIKIHPDALTQLILAANQDVRQTLNMLSMWSVNNKHLENDQIKKEVDSAKKDIKMGPWEAVRKVFTEDEQKKMSLNDKSDLFFYDYSLAPLFVQENYLHVVPHCSKNEILKRVSMAADSISMGDLVENRIRSKGSWNLLPMQAMYSSVIPGHVMCGHVAGQIQFPSWLGKNSRASKLTRLVQEIHAHTRLSTSGSKSSIFLDYSKHLRDAIVMPLIRDKLDGIPKSLEVLQSYHLLRDDLDSLTEIATWPGQRDPMVLVDSKVKAAMTRTYNKEASALPYAPGNVKRSRGKVDAESGDLLEDNIEQEDENSSDSDPENDMLIKKKKKSSVKHQEIEKPSTNNSDKGKGKGKKSKIKSK